GHRAEPSSRIPFEPEHSGGSASERGQFPAGDPRALRTVERGPDFFAAGGVRKMPVKEVAAPEAKNHKARSDHELVEGCRRGREQDWNSLIDKYKNLIFSIPIRYGLSREEAADVFQSVCLDLINELPRIRDPKALPKWL